MGQVLETRPGVQLNYPDVAESLRFYLGQQRLGVAWQSWVAEQLKRADIVYAEDYEPADPTNIGPAGSFPKTTSPPAGLPGLTADPATAPPTGSAVVPPAQVGSATPSPGPAPAPATPVPPGR